MRACAKFLISFSSAFSVHVCCVCVYVYVFVFVYLYVHIYVQEPGRSRTGCAISNRLAARGIATTDVHAGGALATSPGSAPWPLWIAQVLLLNLLLPLPNAAQHHAESL